MPLSVSDLSSSKLAVSPRPIPLPRFLHVCQEAARYYDRQAREASSATQAADWKAAREQAQAAGAIVRTALSIAHARAHEQLQDFGLEAFAAAIQTGDFALHLGLPPEVCTDR